jgi:hypothetical protein
MGLGGGAVVQAAIASAVAMAQKRVEIRMGLTF